MKRIGGHRARAFHRGGGRRLTAAPSLAPRSGRNSSPWYLKQYGSRPAGKLRPPKEEVP